MRKWLAVMFAVLLLLPGCKRNMDDIIQNEPMLIGIVEEVRNGSFMMDSNGAKYVVPLAAENPDSYTSVAVGDTVCVYYDGTVQETWPMQINNVYAICLQTPADRTENERP